LISIAFCQTNRLFILLERAEKEIRFSMANGMFKIKMDIDRHGPRYMLDNCKNFNPPYFSLPSTFNAALKPVLRIRIFRILMFFSVPDPHPDSYSHKYGSKVRILLSLSKNSKKNVDFYCFGTFYDSLSLKNV
jgi:hypothetical protein